MVIGTLAPLVFASLNQIWGAPLQLSQKIVAEKVLQQSRQAQELRLTTGLSALTYKQVLGTYDWTLSAESGYQLTRFRNFAGTANPQDESYTSTAGLKKPWISGTITTATVTRTSQQSVYSASSTSTAPAQQTQDVLGLQVEQNLLRNFFGKMDRSLISAAEKNERAAVSLLTNQLQQVVLTGIRLFWQTAVAQENFKQAVFARDRYLKLVDSVQRKKRLGSTTPAELAQVEAELENQNQLVKSSSATFLSSLDQLLTFLKIEKTEDIEFRWEPLPELPSPSIVRIEDLREIKALNLKLEAAEAALAAARSKAYPDISFVGRYEVSGLAQKSSDSATELANGNYPRYYYGLKFSHSFGSDLQGEEITNRSLQRDLQNSVYARRKVEIADELAAAIRKLQATHSIAVSAEKLKNWRDQAARELQSAYAQGRTDIRFLIDALNQAFSAQVLYSRSVGDFHIALNEWTAMQDSLVLPKPETQD